MPAVELTSVAATAAAVAVETAAVSAPAAAAAVGLPVKHLRLVPDHRAPSRSVGCCCGRFHF